MPSERADIEIAEIDRVEIAVEPWSWEFASDAARRDRSEFCRAVSAKVRRSGTAGCFFFTATRFAMACCEGACFETDYASFLAWRDWGFPDASVFNVFASAALQAADGAFLLGEMGPIDREPGLGLFPLRHAGS